MKKLRKTGMIWMPAITAFIIAAGIVMVNISQNLIERQLLSQTIPLQEAVETGNDYLQINYPWEASAAALRKANAEEIRRFEDSGYAGQLEELALLLGGVSVNTKAFQVDEKGCLIYKGSKKELSYAVDLEKGILGFGMEAATETDDTVKEKNCKELLASLADPMYELYWFLPTVNHILGREINDGLYGREEKEGYQDSFNSMKGLQRQVLYYFNVLTLILQTQERYIILQYNPAEEQFTSYYIP